MRKGRIPCLGSKTASKKIFIRNGSVTGSGEAQKRGSTMLDNQILVTKEDLDHFEQKLDLLNDQLSTILLIARLPTIVKISHIARMENVSVSFIRGKGRYLLPRFGVSAFEDGTTRWPMREYLEWRAIPPEKRKQMWKDLPAKERQRIVMGKYADAS